MLLGQHRETGRHCPHCPLCTCASSSIPRPEFSYTHVHTSMSVHCDVVLLCPTCHITRRSLVTMLSYISLPPRYVSFGRCPSVRACPFTSVVKSCHREDWVFVNKPHCLHTHHMYVPVPPLSPWRDVARCHSASSLLYYINA